LPCGFPGSRSDVISGPTFFAIGSAGLRMTLCRLATPSLPCFPNRVITNCGVGLRLCAAIPELSQPHAWPSVISIAVTWIGGKRQTRDRWNLKIGSAG
jgi:hypothetical protein